MSPVTASACCSAYIEGRWLSANALVGLYPADTVHDDDMERHTGERRSAVAHNELQRWLAPNL